MSERQPFLERFMFRRVPMWVLLLIVLLGLLASLAFSALVLHAARGGTRFKSVQGIALQVAGAPFVLRDVIGGFDAWSASADGARVPPGFWKNPQEPFTDPGFLLIPGYDADRGTSFVRLLRLSDGRILREYRPNIALLTAESERLWTPTSGNRAIPYQIAHPYLMPDGGLVFNGRSTLVRTDACDRVQWVRGGFHHSIERNPAGNFWVPSVLPAPREPYVAQSFRDDTVALVTPEGRTLFERPMSRIFTENGLDHLVRGRPYVDDPYHLNDIEQVHEDGRYWRRGDLFLSLRHQSMILLYRPSTGRVIWSHAGPWLAQHDVSILDNHRISIFDNRVALGSTGDNIDGTNRLIVYDFSTGRLSSPYDRGFTRLGLRSVVGGRGTPLSNGDLFVEDTNGGRLVRMSANGNVRWTYGEADGQGRRYRLAWARYLDSATFGPGVRATIGAQCR